MLLRASIYLNAVVFLLLIPVLEIGPTHVFNADWPAHAKLHEVWQLVSNGLLSILSVLLLRWAQSRWIAGAIGLTINIGFLAALVAANGYGGSMVHSDGTELLIAGINPASAILAALSLGILGGLLQNQKARSPLR